MGLCDLFLYHTHTLWSSYALNRHGPRPSKPVQEGKDGCDQEEGHKAPDRRYLAWDRGLGVHDWVCMMQMWVLGKNWSVQPPAAARSNACMFPALLSLPICAQYSTVYNGLIEACLMDALPSLGGAHIALCTMA
jgi:hypothetical protein